jgi:hypothetical protein
MLVIPRVFSLVEYLAHDLGGDPRAVGQAFEVKLRDGFGREQEFPREIIETAAQGDGAKIFIELNNVIGASRVDADDGNQEAGCGWSSCQPAFVPNAKRRRRHGDIPQGDYQDGSIRGGTDSSISD